MSCESCGGSIRSDNKTGICTSNPDCRSEYERRSPRKRVWQDRQNVRSRQREREFQDHINAIKSDAGCFDCGFNVTPLALEFDHLPQFKKSFEIGRAANRNWETVLAEIAKCQIVCRNCHVVRTVTRRRQEDA